VSGLAVVKGHPQMLTYINSLQNKESESISFYPSQVFEREMPAGKLYLGMLNGEPCGYVYRGALGVDVRCYQVCIQYDARLRSHGKALMDAVEADAERVGAYSITLRCGFELSANLFWQSLGYDCVQSQDGGLRRSRRINVWRKHFQPVLFPVAGLVPETGEVSKLAWRARNREMYGFTT